MPYVDKEKERAYLERNKDRIGKRKKEYYKKYYQEHIEEEKLKSKIYRIQNKNRIKNFCRLYYQSPKGRYTSYKHGSKARGIVFTLTFDEFFTFWQKSCEYCGGEVSTIGLDRIDSNKGYQIDNVVSCCSKCNYMKLDHSKEEFFDQCYKILKFQGII